MESEGEMMRRRGRRFYDRIGFLFLFFFRFMYFFFTLPLLHVNLRFARFIINKEQCFVFG